MSATYGYLYSEKSQAVTRGGNRYVAAKLQTYEGKLETEVWGDGRFRVELNGVCIATGNVNERTS